MVGMLATRSGPRWLSALGTVGGLILAQAATAPAEAQIPGLAEWAQAVADASTRRWDGPRVPPPDPEPRPQGLLRARSLWQPLAVHGSPSLTDAVVDASLEALEGARELLSSWGWPEPWPDGGRGGTAGFDLYLVPGNALAGEARADPSVAWAELDGVSSFAIIDAHMPADRLEACVVATYAEAMLLGQDPAEARAWRRATGALLAWLATGTYGCEDGVVRQQQEPWRGWIAQESEDGAGGALLLAMVSGRHDGGSGAFVRDVWQLARQRTWEGTELRASPDLWQALATATDVAGDDLLEIVEETAIARWHTGTVDRERGAPLLALRGLGADALVPAVAELAWQDLPAHTRPADPPLEPFGSGYAIVDVSAAPPNSRLRIWLRGEFGVRWSLVAVRLDRRGRELARLAAPSRREPRSYVPLELLEDTARVLIVVTNLSSRLPDADVADENVRSFKLIVDR